MGQISSREEFREWLQDKPVDWAQVIAARAALRVFPYALVHDGNDSNKWMKGSGIAFFRAVALPLIAFDFPDRDMSETILRAVRHLASTSAHSHAANAILEAGMAFNSHEGMIGGKLQNIISFAVSTVVFEGHSLGRDGNSDSVWISVSEDCSALETDDDPDTAASRLRNNSVTEQLGFVGVGEWASASKRLYNLDPTYDVWLKWYDRRIKGEDAAFDIPGDTNRTEDKNILIRLADATNEEFWSKGATHVNTTLQSWINEASARVAVERDEPEPQNQDVVVFYPDGRGQFDANSAVGANELLTSQEARERYAEACDTASEVLSLCTGHNQVGFIAPVLERYISALGNRPEDCQTGNIIQRGERVLSAVADAIAELTPASPDEPVPIRTKQLLSALEALPKAYHALVNFDPALARRIPLLLEPGQTQVSISPEQYRGFIKNAVKIGILTETAENVLIEAGDAIAGSDEATVPSTYRYLEIARNFPRAMVAFLWKHKSAIAKGTAAGVAGLVSAGVVFVANQAALLQFFAGSPNMIWFLEQLSALLKMAP